MSAFGTKRTSNCRPAMSACHLRRRETQFSRAETETSKRSLQSNRQIAETKYVHKSPLICTEPGKSPFAQDCVVELGGLSWGSAKYWSEWQDLLIGVFAIEFTCILATVTDACVLALCTLIKEVVQQPTVSRRMTR
jgi:hypothetical protein